MKKEQAIILGAEIQRVLEEFYGDNRRFSLIIYDEENGTADHVSNGERDVVIDALLAVAEDLMDGDGMPPVTGQA